MTLIRVPRPFKGEKIVFSKMVLDQHAKGMQKNEAGPWLHTIAVSPLSARVPHLWIQPTVD